MCAQNLSSFSFLGIIGYVCANNKNNSKKKQKQNKKNETTKKTLKKATPWGEVCGLCPHSVSPSTLYLLPQGRPQNCNLQRTPPCDRKEVPERTTLARNLVWPRVFFIKVALKGSGRLTSLSLRSTKASANIEYIPYEHQAGP